MAWLPACKCCCPLPASPAALQPGAWASGPQPSQCQHFLSCVCTRYFFPLLFKLIPVCLQVQAGGSTKFNTNPYLHKIIHASELLLLEKRKEKELEALSSSTHYSSLATEQSCWCLPVTLPSLQWPRTGEDSEEDHCWHGKGDVRHEAPSETPCKSKDQSQEGRGSESEGHRGLAVDAGQYSMSPTMHTSAPAPNPWGNNFVMQCLTKAAFACAGKWPNFVLY